MDIFALSLIDQTLAFVLDLRLCIPLLFIPHVSLDTPSNFASHVTSGLSCFLFSAATSADTTGPRVRLAVMESCQGVWLPTILFALSNVLMQSVMLLVLRHLVVVHSQRAVPRCNCRCRHCCCPAR